MKKNLIFILCAAMLVSICGCGGKSTDSTSVSNVITSISISTSASASVENEVEAEPEPIEVEIPEYAVMYDVVTLGTYEQDNNTDNGKEPIEWIVLERDGNKALVISRYVLDAVPFVKGFGSAGWEKSSIRTWLNKTFMDCFTDSEKSKILESFVPSKEQTTITDEAGNVITPDVPGTNDRVFLLSDFEVNKYLTDDADTWGDEAYAQATAYAAAKGVWVLTQERYAVLGYTEETVSKKMIGSGWWWLRSPGLDAAKTQDVDTQGNIRVNGHDNGESHDGIRPAMWITVE